MLRSFRITSPSRSAKKSADNSAPYVYNYKSTRSLTPPICPPRTRSNQSNARSRGRPTLRSAGISENKPIQSRRRNRNCFSVCVVPPLEVMPKVIPMDEGQRVSEAPRVLFDNSSAVRTLREEKSKVREYALPFAKKEVLGPTSQKWCDRIPEGQRRSVSPATRSVESRLLYEQRLARKKVIAEMLKNVKQRRPSPISLGSKRSVRESPQRPLTDRPSSRQINHKIPVRSPKSFRNYEPSSEDATNSSAISGTSSLFNVQSDWISDTVARLQNRLSSIQLSEERQEQKADTNEVDKPDEPNQPDIPKAKPKKRDLVLELLLEESDEDEDVVWSVIRHQKLNH